jgi:hypothetical protein
MTSRRPGLLLPVLVWLWPLCAEANVGLSPLSGLLLAQLLLVPLWLLFAGLLLVFARTRRGRRAVAVVAVLHAAMAALNLLAVVAQSAEITAQQDVVAFAGVVLVPAVLALLGFRLLRLRTAPSDDVGGADRAAR